MRSVSNGEFVEPSSKMRTYGDRSFAVCAPGLWNSLPLSIRRNSSVDIFKSVLKLIFLKCLLVTVIVISLVELSHGLFRWSLYTNLGLKVEFSA